MAKKPKKTIVSANPYEQSVASVLFGQNAPQIFPGTSVTTTNQSEADTLSTPVGSQDQTTGDTIQSTVPKDTGPDAKQILSKLLTDNGLGDLSEDIWTAFGEMKLDQNTSIDQLGFMIKDTDSYKKRFAGNVARSKAGKPEFSISQYLSMEQQYKNAIQGKGIPSGFYDTYEDYSNFIGNDISPAEIADRVDNGFRAVNEGDPEILRQLKQFYPDVDTGSLAAFFLDPEKTTPVIVNRAKAAQIGAQAVRQAGMQLSESEAQFVRQQGLSPEESAQAFAQIQSEKQLYAQNFGEEEISRQTQLEAATGNAQAMQRVAAKKRRRQAEFEAGGGFTPSKTGIAGLTTVQ